jgi:hypothetical protein
MSVTPAERDDERNGVPRQGTERDYVTDKTFGVTAAHR